MRKYGSAESAQRYLPFYDRLLELGARKYFDAVPLHGRDYNADTFRALDRKHGVASPVYTSSEWHTVLISADKLPPNPESTEREISKVMLLDLLRQKRSGIREVTAFGLIGWIRKEGLRHHLSPRQLPRAGDRHLRVGPLSHAPALRAGAGRAGRPLPRIARL